MFKVGIYKNQLNLIVIILVFLSIGQISQWIEDAFKPIFEEVVTTTNEDATVKGVTFTSKKDIDVSLPEYEPDSEMREWMEDYQLRIIDNGTKLVLFDGDRIVHVFDRAYKGNKNLFNTIDRDNW